MANWDKLNKEFDDALESMTREDWDSFVKRCKVKLSAKGIISDPYSFIENLDKIQGIEKVKPVRLKAVDVRSSENNNSSDLFPIIIM